MKKVCIIGHFGGGKTFLDGQTVKTKIVTRELKDKLGENEVSSIDTYGGKKVLVKCFFKCFSALKNHNNIIMMPAHNGIRFFTPVLFFCNTLFNRKLHYSVIGGWLPEYLSEHKLLAAMLKKFDFIYAETNPMKKALEAQGFRNIFVMPNCKELTPLSESELVYQSAAPYKLCTFSRVMKEKGIEDAVEAVKAVNLKFGKTVYTLDIYGQVDPRQTEWFDKLKADFPEYVTYGGLVEFDKSVEVLKDYFALLFPTRFFTEGIPGTIIDAYAAGVPVISARWQSFCDIIDDRSTGIGYVFGDTEDLKQKLLDIAECKYDINSFKLNCLEKSKAFMPSGAIKVLLKQIT